MQQSTHLFFFFSFSFFPPSLPPFLLSFFLMLENYLEEWGASIVFRVWESPPHPRSQMFAQQTVWSFWEILTDRVVHSSVQQPPLPQVIPQPNHFRKRAVNYPLKSFLEATFTSCSRDPNCNWSIPSLAELEIGYKRRPDDLNSCFCCFCHILCTGLCFTWVFSGSGKEGVIDKTSRVWAPGCWGIPGQFTPLFTSTSVETLCIEKENHELPYFLDYKAHFPSPNLGRKMGGASYIIVRM